MLRSPPKVAIAYGKHLYYPQAIVKALKNLVFVKVY
jgi:hypothetical protein